MIVTTYDCEYVITPAKEVYMIGHLIRVEVSISKDLKKQ